MHGEPAGAKTAMRGPASSVQHPVPNILYGSAMRAEGPYYSGKEKNCAVVDLRPRSEARICREGV